MGYGSCQEDAEKQRDDAQWSTEIPGYFSGCSQTLSLQAAYELQQEHKFLREKEAKSRLLEKQQLEKKISKHEEKQVYSEKFKKKSKNKPKFKKQKLKNAKLNKRLRIPNLFFILSPIPSAEETYSSKPNKRLKQRIISIYREDGEKIKPLYPKRD